MPQQEAGEFRLSKFHTNELYDTLKQGAVPIADFSLTHLTAEIKFRRFLGVGTVTQAWPVTAIRHGGTRSLFVVARFTKRGFSHIQKVAFDGSDTEAASTLQSRWADRSDWNWTRSALHDWGKAVAQAIESEQVPDLWKQLNLDKEAFEGHTDQGAGNTIFTSDEQAEVTARINQAKNYVRALPELTEDQVSRIVNRLDDMEEAGKRIGRKDWLMMFNGAVFSLVLADTITPQVAEHIAMLVIHGLGHLFGYGGPPPHLSGP